MNRKVTITARWYGRVPERNGKPLPTNQWSRAGRKRVWAVRWYAPDGSRPRQSFATLDEAEVYARSKTAEFETAGDVARIQPKTVTLGEFVAEVLKLRTGPRGQRLSIGALREYQTILNRFSSFLGAGTHLARVTMGDATRFLAELRTPTKPSDKTLSTPTLNKYKRVLRSSFNIAVVQLEYLRVNPFERLKQDKTADKTPQYITPEQLHAIIEACRAMGDPLWWECFITLSYTAGTRLNETAHLSWMDIDFAAGTVHVAAKPDGHGIEAWTPKDHDNRLIPVPPQTIDLLSRLQAEVPAGSDFVFIRPERVEWIAMRREAGQWREGQSVLNNVNKNFQRRAAAAGVTNVTLHDLRRSALSNWARKLSAVVVRELAGHSDINTTLRYYLSIRQADLDEARDVAAEVLRLDPRSTQISK